MEPTTTANTSMFRPIKVGALLTAALFVGLYYLFRVNDPCADLAPTFLRSSPEVAAELGPVQETRVRRIVAVQDAISVSDQFVPGYRSYDVVVKGSRASALVTVETGLKNCSFRITAIDRD